MIPLGTIVSLAGQAASGIMSVVNNKRVARKEDAEYARQQAEYAARENENPLSRSESRAALNAYDKSAEQQVETARNVSKITGATPEYSLGVQKAAQEGRGNVVGGIAADASARADAERDAEERSRQAQADAEIARMQARNETYANLAGNAANAFGGIIDGYQTKEENNSEEDDGFWDNVRSSNKGAHEIGHASNQGVKVAGQSPSDKSGGQSPSLKSIMEEGMKRLRTQF